MIDHGSGRYGSGSGKDYTIAIDHDESGMSHRRMKLCLSNIADQRSRAEHGSKASHHADPH